MKNFSLSVDNEQISIAVKKTYCIGFSGRDREKVMEHIHELAEIGVPEPDDIPTLFPMRLSSLTQDSKIEILGDETSGEAEIVLIFGDSSDEIFVTVGSDHTDRSLETVDINKSKQICDKPFAQKAWRFQDVTEYWDQLKLGSKVLIDGAWVPYQEQTVASILHPQEILSYLKNKNISLKNTVVFSGTVPLINGFKYGNGFSMQFIDPVKNDSINYEYQIEDISEKK